MTRIVLVLVASAAALALLFVGISPAPATRPVDREKSLKIFIVKITEKPMSYNLELIHTFLD